MFRAFEVGEAVGVYDSEGRLVRRAAVDAVGARGDVYVAGDAYLPSGLSLTARGQRIAPLGAVQVRALESQTLHRRLLATYAVLAEYEALRPHLASDEGFDDVSAFAALADALAHRSLDTLEASGRPGLARTLRQGLPERAEESISESPTPSLAPPSEPDTDPARRGTNPQEAP